MWTLFFEIFFKEECLGFAYLTRRFFCSQEFLKESIGNNGKVENTPRQI